MWTSGGISYEAGKRVPHISSSDVKILLLVT